MEVRNTGLLRHGMSRLSGQMTVEFVAMFPVMIVIALIAVNATLFLSECSAFDRVFRNAVCTYAASPAYGQDAGQSCALVESALREQFSAENLTVQVSSSGTEGGIVTFNGKLSFEPTLFGMGALHGAFGVSFPALTHEGKFSVSAYKPGVVV